MNFSPIATRRWEGWQKNIKEGMIWVLHGPAGVESNLGLMRRGVLSI